jgi:hypothetical protein
MIQVHVPQGFGVQVPGSASKYFAEVFESSADKLPNPVGVIETSAG